MTLAHAMHSEYQRLLSFQVPSFQGSPLWFAEAGFYLDENVIKCAFCSLTFPLGRYIDEPFREHIETNPKCPFVTFENRLQNIPLEMHSIHPIQRKNTKLEYVRLKTFKHAPFIFSKQCEMLVETGLYYDHDLDIKNSKLRCSFCAFSASLYDGSDFFSSLLVEPQELFNRHVASFSSVCPLLKILLIHGTVERSSQKRRIHLSQHKNYNDLIGNVMLADTHLVSQPKYPEKEDPNIRYITFLNSEWPFQTDDPVKYPHLSIEEFVRCGFSYVGRADYVTCYWCGVTLGKWHVDHLVHENHITYRDQCPVAIQTMKFNPERYLLSPTANVGTSATIIPTEMPLPPPSPTVTFFEIRSAPSAVPTMTATSVATPSTTTPPTPPVPSTFKPIAKVVPVQPVAGTCSGVTINGPIAVNEDITIIHDDNFRMEERSDIERPVASTTRPRDPRRNGYAYFNKYGNKYGDKYGKRMYEYGTKMNAKGKKYATKYADAITHISGIKKKTTKPCTTVSPNRSTVEENTGNLFLAPQTGTANPIAEKSQELIQEETIHLENKDYKCESKNGANLYGFSCVICMEKDRSVVFESCRHFMCCDMCSKKVTHCPCCRKTISSKMSVYI